VPAGVDIDHLARDDLANLAPPFRNGFALVDIRGRGLGEYG